MRNPVGYAFDIEELRVKVEKFIEEEVIPLEHRADGDTSDELRLELQLAARSAGIFAPHVSPEYGGLGLNMRQQSVIFEEAGYSLLGPLALNCSAPDEGNMTLLEKVANDKQKQQYLHPLARGRIRSCIAMTEPAPGAGSDPSMLRTVASRVDDGWIIDGHKWYITGAVGAAFALVLARTEEAIHEGVGATIFIVDADNPGMKIERRIGSLDDGFIGGHSEIVFERCFVDDTAVLGEVHRGLAHARMRLAPARLTHCMRWLGIARRAQDIALDRAGVREAFGSLLGDLGMVQNLIADNEIDMVASRLLIRDAASTLDEGLNGMEGSSIAKVFVAEAIFRVVDRCIQICGSLGISTDLPLSRFLREVRPFRIYDGPSEAHRWSIAKRAIRRRGANVNK